MSKENVTPRTMAQVIKVADYHNKELQEMAKDVSRRMLEDQAEWLDAQMKDILPPRLYDYGKRGDKEQEIGEYLRKHNIRLIHIADAMAMRIMIGDRVHSEFRPQFTVDGEPVRIEPQPFIQDSQN